MVCCGKGNGAVAELLLEHHADLHAIDAEGQTCLHYAAQAGFPALVRLLVTKGVDPSVLTANAKTALCLAKAGETQSHKEVVDLLVGDVRTMLQSAVRRGDIR